eukprot:gene20090-20630_t
MRKRMAILVVEDDPDIGSLLKRGLGDEGFEVTVVDTVETALAAVRQETPQAVILDIIEPDRASLDICRTLRADGFAMPIVMLSAKAAIAERAEGLRAGADDYVVKPFAFSEMVARLKTHMLRRSEPATSGRDLRQSEIALDLDTRTVRIGTGEARLTERECALFALLLQHAGHPVGRDDLFAAVWGGQDGGSRNVVDVYVGYLRRKLAAIADHGDQVIVTVRGRGFMLQPTET